MDKLEEVARALHDEWNGVGLWSSLTDTELKRWRFMARAAIEAMREPTGEMLGAFVDGEDPGYTSDWQTMVDAALTPSSAPSPQLGPSENTVNSEGRSGGE